MEEEFDAKFDGVKSGSIQSEPRASSPDEPQFEAPAPCLVTLGSAADPPHKWLSGNEQFASFALRGPDYGPQVGSVDHRQRVLRLEAHSMENLPYRAPLIHFHGRSQLVGVDAELGRGPDLYVRANHEYHQATGLVTSQVDRRSGDRQIRVPTTHDHAYQSLSGEARRAGGAVAASGH
jgi:hypothetical protein